MRRVLWGIVIATLVSIILNSALGIQMIRGKSSTLNGPAIKASFVNVVCVDDDNLVGPWDGTAEHPYRNITSGLEHASANDTVFVYNGTYYEHLTVDKPLTLFGESKESTIVDGNRTGTVIGVTADNVIISGFTVRNSNQSAGTSYAGIRILGSGCNVTGNSITRNKIGVFVTSQDSRIVENIVTDNGQGIALYDSSGVTVEANNVSANTVGISLAFSSRNMIVDNMVVNSSEGGHGITLSSSSFNNTILNNDLVRNYHGMWLSNSFGNSAFNNTIANNELLGIELASSPDNSFYHNNFVNNPKHIVIGGMSTGIWDDGYPSGGNYWSDYMDMDYNSGPYQNVTGSDGIWDHPYVIDASSRDNYPLAEPWSLGDTMPPMITGVSQDPEHVEAEDEVQINATVIDMLTGVKQVVLNYTTDNVTWFSVIMTKHEQNVYNATIQRFPYDTNVTYSIKAEDNEGNIISTDEMGYEYGYYVIPEFGSLSLLLFMITTLAAFILRIKRRSNQASAKCSNKDNCRQNAVLHAIPK